MTFKFSGDFGKIDRFIRKLRTVKGVVAKVRGMMADFALADITRKANAGLNPYGRAWISGPFYNKLGSIPGAYGVKSSASGFTLFNTNPNTGFHQSGAKRSRGGRLPKRQVLPSAGRMPPGWRRGFRTIVIKEFKAHFG